MADLTGLDLFCTALKTEAETVTGINVVMEFPAEGVNDMPAVVFYPTNVRASNPAAKKFVYSFNFDIILARGDLSHSFGQVRKYFGRGLQLFYGNLTMGGTGCTLENVTGALVNMSSVYGTPCAGIRFTFDVKLQHTDLTLSA